MEDLTILSSRLYDTVSQILKVVDADPSVLGSLSVDDYMWVLDVVRVTAMYKAV